MVSSFRRGVRPGSRGPVGAPSKHRQRRRGRFYARGVLRLWIVGRMAATWDDVPLGMPTSERARALVGWLALHPGPRPRAELAAVLWPSTPAERARANLRTAIWAVHRAWGDRALQADRSSVGLVAGTWVDANDGADAEGEL